MKRTRSIKGKDSEEEEFQVLKLAKKVAKTKTIGKIKKKENKKIKIEIKKTLNEDKEIILKKETKIVLTKKIKHKKSKSDSLMNLVKVKGVSLLGPVCIRLGLCCLNNYLKSNKNNSVFCSRSLTLSTYKSKGKDEAVTRATQNVKDIEAMLRWNHAHYIHCLRLSSDMFPHYTNVTRIEEDRRYTLDFAKPYLEKAGVLARSLGHRITMHPGQFNVVGTPNEDSFNQTVVDLTMHADILDIMGMDDNSIMVVHGGGTYGDKEETIKRWIKNFYRLPPNVQRRLVLENDEKNFSVIDCLKVNEEVGIPVVFDNHHFECYKKMHPKEEFEDIRLYIKSALETWTKKGLRPKFHISNQAPDKNTGAHSDYIQEFPQYYLEIPEKYGIGVDIMIEAKAKEAAIFDLYQRYKSHFLQHVLTDENLEDAFEFDKEKMQAKKCSRC